MKAEAPLRLQLVGVSKSFPGVRANDNVSLSVKPGEIHALLGENGAGKSTLVKMIYGILAPDEGQIIFDGSPQRISNPRAARRLGIHVFGWTSTARRGCRAFAWGRLFARNCSPG